ncbi:SDR family oxidoreductase [Sphingobacterium oryzagri]|uniref:SDR family oxidoreductase n=1 Tax=Sphingobacterium oryzagri TaxID=3025669 RepID=A0ABY7WBE2_9SPHI|nr:SDR family oxidoreductase [Sphingobacterium sp. KACC 22765]WDF66964.1 SDR family oxidoreductase [Sphingobacterium sp. KACC 22765]
MTDTDGARNLGILGTDVEKVMIASTPLGRIGQPKDIAPIVAFLASDEAAWITGEIIGTSGGAR